MTCGSLNCFFKDTVLLVKADKGVILCLNLHQSHACSTNCRAVCKTVCKMTQSFMCDTGGSGYKVNSVPFLYEGTWCNCEVFASYKGPLDVFFKEPDMWHVQVVLAVEQWQMCSVSVIRLRSKFIRVVIVWLHQTSTFSCSSHACCGLKARHFFLDM